MDVFLKFVFIKESFDFGVLYVVFPSGFKTSPSGDKTNPSEFKTNPSGDK